MSEAQRDAEEKRKARFGAAAGVLPPGVLPSRVLPWLQPDVRPGELAQRVLAALKAAALSEIETRRLFLWVPVAAGAGVVLYFVADREPALWLTGSLAGAAALSAWFARRHFAVFALCVAIAALFAGLFSAGWRTARVAAPVLDRIRIATLTGYIEQVDLRREGARLVMRIDKAEGLAPEITPYRVRLTTRREPGLEAGSFVSLKARLLPPAHAALPGGYDFARDAYYMRIGAVGSVLGKMQAVAPPDHPGLFASLHMSIDRARNALARRVASSVEGDAGAIAVAMVTGKRDFLSEDAKDLVREAGIFHIITISGVQMTLVAGILFFMARLLLTLLPGFALRYPIKKWAAGFAILGAIAYDIMTGSRVGTERALFMTMIMLGAIIAGRPAITMRNLGLAALVVIILEPEAIMGASFQLSFAAVSALVAVYETRIAGRMKAIAANAGGTNWQAQRSSLIFDPVGAFLRLGHWAREAGIATLCATSATASYMAYDFHELSPYVLIGNPLTLALIEFFAVPGALLGAVLYPLGLDGPVWAYVGLGIRLVLEVARWIAAAPGATVHLRDFAPWSIAFLLDGGPVHGDLAELDHARHCGALRGSRAHRRNVRRAFRYRRSARRGLCCCPRARWQADAHRQEAQLVLVRALAARRCRWTKTCRCAGRPLRSSCLHRLAAGRSDTVAHSRPAGFCRGLQARGNHRHQRICARLLRSPPDRLAQEPGRRRRHRHQARWRPDHAAHRALVDRGPAMVAAKSPRFTGLAGRAARPCPCT